MKLSSINLNYLIATGAATLYITLVVFVVRPQNKIAITVLCHVSHSLSSFLHHYNYELEFSSI